MIRTGRTNVSKSEQIYYLRSVSTLHFTELVPQYDHEAENISGLLSNRVSIIEINAQSIQPLKYKLWLWWDNKFEDTDIDLDSYKTSILLDFSLDDGESVDRLNNANQYYIDSSQLEILYDDLDKTKTLHCSLQNISATSKNAGPTGAVQFDFGYALRL